MEDQNYQFYKMLIFLTSVVFATMMITSVFRNFHILEALKVFCVSCG